MKRREFVAGTGMLVGAAFAPGAVAAPDDAAAVKQVIRDGYSIFYTDRNKQKYRSLLTNDYLLLESAVLRRSGTRWRVALPHSTQIRKEQ